MQIYHVGSSELERERESNEMSEFFSSENWMLRSNNSLGHLLWNYIEFLIGLLTFRYFAIRLLFLYEAGERFPKKIS